MADAPSMYWRLNELGQLPVADSSGNNRAGTYRAGLTFGQAGALTDTSTGVLSPGASGVAYTNQQVTNPQVYSLEAFVKTTSNGGKILGLENAQTGFGTTYDRHLYMTGGRIAYGILAGGVQQVIMSPNTYNNGVYHHIVATQGAGGMALYIDGVLIGTNPTVAPDAANGYWRLGGGNLTGWPNAPGASALGGTYDEVAVYPTALPAGRVLAHYNAASASATPPPAAPTNLHTTAVTATTADLAWDAPAGTITSYKVFRNGVLRGSPTTTAFPDTGLVSGQTYSYTVTATSADGESAPSASLLVTTPNNVAPSMPANLQAPTVTVSQVVLTWNSSSDNVGVPTYEVLRDGVQIGSPSTNTFTDTTVVANNAYSYHTYTVRARDAALNSSAPSTAVVVTTPDGTAPSVPTGLATSSVSSTSVALTWNASTDNVAVTGYDVRRGGTLIGSPSGTTFTDNTVVANQTYSYTVSARDGAGNVSDPSTALVVTASDPDPTLFTDLFAGPTGSAWGPTWTTNVTNGTATQQSGTGQLALTDTAGAFSQSLLSGLAARTNSETVLSYQFNSTTPVAYFSVYARGSGGWQNSYRPRNGYGLEIRPSSATVDVIRNVNGTTTTLTSVAGARQVSTAKQWIRLRVSGTTIQFRMWVDGQPEPAAWTSTLTDSTVTAAGQLHLSMVRGGSNTGSKDVRVDDVRITDAP